MNMILNIIKELVKCVIGLIKNFIFVKATFEKVVLLYCPVLRIMSQKVFQKKKYMKAFGI